MDEDTSEDCVQLAEPVASEKTREELIDDALERVQAGLPIINILNALADYVPPIPSRQQALADTGDHSDVCSVCGDNVDDPKSLHAAADCYRVAMERFDSALNCARPPVNWVPVAERLPTYEDGEAGGLVWVIMTSGYVRSWGYWSVEDWRDQITQWAPIVAPAPPTEGE